MLAHELHHALERNVFVVAGLFFGGRREDRLGELLALLQSRRQRHAADGAMLLILLPPGTGEIAAHHAFDGHHLRLADQHRAARQCVSLRREGGPHVRKIAAQEMIRDAEIIEPEERQGRQHAALVRNGGRQHPVKGADAIGRDNHQTIAEVVHVAHLAATDRIPWNLALK